MSSYDFIPDTLTLFLGLNTVLILVDAAIGYHVAPLLLRGSVDGEIQVAGVRRLLAFMVALYMFFSCLAYVRQQQSYLTLVTIIVVLDVAIQLVLRNRFRANSGQ